MALCNCAWSDLISFYFILFCFTLSWFTLSLSPLLPPQAVAVCQEPSYAEGTGRARKKFRSDLDRGLWRGPRIGPLCCSTQRIFLRSEIATKRCSSGSFFPFELFLESGLLDYCARTALLIFTAPTLCPHRSSPYFRPIFLFMSPLLCLSFVPYRDFLKNNQLKIAWSEMVGSATSLCLCLLLQPFAKIKDKRVSVPRFPSG